jgi:hypothetical protein
MLQSRALNALRALVGLAALIAGCEEPSRPLVIAEYEIQANQIAAVEFLLDRTAAKHDLRTFRKNRDHMATLTEDKPAFFTALYLKEELVLVVSNVGVGSVLHVSANGSPPLASVEVLGVYQEFIAALEQELALKKIPAAT